MQWFEPAVLRLEVITGPIIYLLAPADMETVVTTQRGGGTVGVCRHTVCRPSPCVNSTRRQLTLQVTLIKASLRPRINDETVIQSPEWWSVALCPSGASSSCSKMNVPCLLVGSPPSFSPSASC